jgi:hypothetical protein
MIKRNPIHPRGLHNLARVGMDRHPVQSADALGVEGDDWRNGLCHRTGDRLDRHPTPWPRQAALGGSPSLRHDAGHHTSGAARVRWEQGVPWMATECAERR